LAVCQSVVVDDTDGLTPTERGSLILPRSRLLPVLTERGFVMEPYRPGKSTEIIQ